ncbi:putative 50S ribosomal protein L1 [Venustampulla echinocandica]|uniref:Putative 50S ribosomal protein L1 n=1 Tax=Venustampulla echinocandica TaxID=2656787 RepID=A0A370TLR3_9HELO|nr:putative 50S ribosomal protein L1 [Venustampulla echinocandica]RDL36466.1 putative 50S ribosomal protein L1 [Venustampulla echinocandica]
MATARPCLAQLSRSHLYPIPPISSSFPIRLFSTTTPVANAKGKKIQSKKVKPEATNRPANHKKVTEKKKKPKTHYTQYDLKKEEQFSLLDAMRYIRAWEVGQKPTSVKYEMHLKIYGLKNGPVVRNRIRLPHPVKTDFKVCVICPPDSKYAEAAKAAGAMLVGEDEVFDAVKDGKIEFDRCICQTDSMSKMNKSGIGRILGPRGLMPSSKTGTVVADPVKAMKDMVGASEYRERMGVVRMAVGQLGFTPQQMSTNIKAFIEAVKADIGRLSDKINKNLAEVVLSSTNGPGFPLSGSLKDSKTSVTEKELSGS